MNRTSFVRLAAAVVAAGTWASSARADLVNGGFEMPVTVGSFQTLNAGSTALTGWTIVSGSVDVVGTFWQPFQGQQSLDLDGNAPGTISQTFGTTAGTTYTLTFAYANNPMATTTPSAEVTLTGANSAVLLDQTVSHSGSTNAVMNYTPFSQTFTANSALTTITFTSKDGANVPYGIALDAVSVTAAVPEPSTLGLVAVGLMAFAGRAIRRLRRLA